MNSTKTFKFMGMTVSVETVGEDDIIRVEGWQTAFYVGADWTVDDTEKDGASFVIPVLKGEKRGEQKKARHGLFLPQPLNYWVSEDLKHTVSVTNHRALGFDGIASNGYFISDSGATGLIKDGKHKQTTEPPFVAGLFAGKAVYVTFPAQEHGVSRYADVRIADGKDGQPDTQIAAFNLSSTEAVLSDVDLDSNPALDRSIATWTASPFPLTFTGTGCFTPDGKTIYLLCGTTGLKKEGSDYFARHTYAKKHVFAIYLGKDSSGKITATGSMWGAFGEHEHRKNGAYRLPGAYECHRIFESTRTAVLSVYPVKIKGGYGPAAFEVELSDDLTTIGMDYLTSRPVGGGVGLPRTGAGGYQWKSTAKIKADGKVIMDVSPPASAWKFDKSTWDDHTNLLALDVPYPMVIPELLSSIDSTTIVVDVVGYSPETQTLVYGIHTDRRVKPEDGDLVSTRSVRFEVARNGAVVAQSEHAVSCADGIQAYTPIPLTETQDIANRYSDRASGDYTDDVSVGIGNAFGSAASPMVAIGSQVGIQLSPSITSTEKISDLCASSIDGVVLASLIAQCRPSGDYGYGQGNEVIKEIFSFDPDIPNGLEFGRLLLIDELREVEDITDKFIADRPDGNTAFPLISVSTYIGKTPKGATT